MYKETWFGRYGADDTLNKLLFDCAFVMVIWSLIFGPQLAILLPFMLFPHELGHVLMLKKYRIPFVGPYPFLLGAVVKLEIDGTRLNRLDQEFMVAIAGPVLGSLAGLLSWGLYFWTSYDPFLFLAYVAFIMNLFNLIVAAWPLDGGKVIGAIAFSIHPRVGQLAAIGSIGIALLFGAFLISYGGIWNILMTAFLCFIVWNSNYQIIKNWRSIAQDLIPMTWPQILGAIVSYTALIILLIFGLYYASSALMLLP